MSTLFKIWDDFCIIYAVSTSSVPLFAVDESRDVKILHYGKDRRPMLRRSPAMQAKVIETVQAILSPASPPEGLLYMMHRLDTDGRVIPLYIGKAGRYGRSGGVSANLKRLDRDEGHFARWGYGYDYHMGDLSAVVLPGHAAGKVKTNIKSGHKLYLSVFQRLRRAYALMFIFGVRRGVPTL